jgi:hypothetical protein
MSLKFYIPQPLAKTNARTLSKGFGLPIVQRAILANTFDITTDKPDAVSLFGTPVYDTLLIEQPTFTTFEFNDFTNEYVQTSNVLGTNTKQVSDPLDANANQQAIKGLFLNGVIIDATIEKNIIKTAMIDKVGTVKEYIGMGDIQLTIRGYVATKNPDEYPDVDAKLIKSYASAPVPLKVTSTFLNDILGITQIVVESCQLSQQQGMRNVQYFQWQAVSDTDYTIERKNV